MKADDQILRKNIVQIAFYLKELGYEKKAAELLMLRAIELAFGGHLDGEAA